MNLERVYGATFIFLVLHQVDAAYWKEWEMFHLPGGIQGFLLFNFLAFPIVLMGYNKLLTQSDNWPVYSYICGCLGGLTLVLHLAFAIVGFKQFHLPFSIAIIGLCGLFGVWQIIATRRCAGNLSEKR